MRNVVVIQGCHSRLLSLGELTSKSESSKYIQPVQEQPQRKESTGSQISKVKAYTGKGRASP